MQVHGLGEGVKNAMAAETKQSKIVIIVASGIILVASTILAGFYLASTANVQSYQTKALEYDKASSIIWYDVDCWDGPFSDTTLALEYKQEIATSDCDSDCLEMGTKWSIIYSLNGSTLLLIAMNMILMIFGAFRFWPRMIGACCNCLLSCIHLAAIITTAVFRFRLQGKLCALSLLPTKIDREMNLSFDRTFETDGQMIIGLWISQLIFFLVFSFGGCFSAKPAKGETPGDLNSLLHHGA